MSVDPCNASNERLANSEIHNPPSNTDNFKKYSGPLSKLSTQQHTICIHLYFLFNSLASTALRFWAYCDLSDHLRMVKFRHVDVIEVLEIDISDKTLSIRMDTYIRKLSQLIVLQLLHASGANNTSESVSDTLSTILCHFISEVGNRAAALTNHARRTECSFHDLMAALSSFKISPYSLSKYLKNTDFIPICTTVPRFPLPSSSYYEHPGFTYSRIISLTETPQPVSITKPLSFSSPPVQEDEENMSEGLIAEDAPEERHFVPHFMPLLPPSHTWSDTPVFGYPLMDETETRQVQLDEKSKVYSALKTLRPTESMFFTIINSNHPLSVDLKTDFNTELQAQHPELQYFISQAVDPVNLTEFDKFIPLTPTQPGPELYSYTIVEDHCLNGSDNEDITIPCPPFQWVEPPETNTGEARKKVDTLKAIDLDEEGFV
ncbi:hypothetical protein P9112_004173 [Eukaryota sp. TZLM1-RC]